VAPANRPPVIPHSPEPADSTEYSGEILVVSWLGGDPDGDIVTYSVEVQEGDAVFAVGQTGYTTMDTGFFLERSTTYNWRVIATDDIDVSEGPWWTIFTPEWTNDPPYPPSTPSPSDGNTGVQTINLNLTWSADDPDEDDTLTFTLYFGTDADPPIIAAGLTETSYALPQLEFGTEYFWRVAATDSRDETVFGPVWSFTTQEQPGGLLTHLGRLLGL
jgi:hypothetical protein